jgi:hypothetical protein
MMKKGGGEKGAKPPSLSTTVIAAAKKLCSLSVSALWDCRHPCLSSSEESPVSATNTLSALAERNKKGRIKEACLSSWVSSSLLPFAHSCSPLTNPHHHHLIIIIITSVTGGGGELVMVWLGVRVCVCNWKKRREIPV